MIDIFDKKNIDLENITCHSGGAVGSDTEWEAIGENFGVKTRAYSWKTSYHNSKNKVEISQEDFNEGVEKIKQANKILKRWNIEKFMSLLARNWAQVKYSNEIFAIGDIVKSKQKNKQGYVNQSKWSVVDGGTGYATLMGILENKPVFVFSQSLGKWFKWSYSIEDFVQIECPKITCQNFAGIGTREITPKGISAIKEVYTKTFKY